MSEADEEETMTEDRMTDTLYKALDGDGCSPYQGHEWPLPNGRPGKWVGPVEGELEECRNGLHCCTADQLSDWLAERLYVIEPREGTEVLEGEDKIVLRESRLVRRVATWNETTARLFAADCAELVLPIWEEEYPEDDRPREAIEAARAYARGGIGEEELSAARPAAWSAARYAAWSAAWPAAGSAAWPAARSAAGYAAGEWTADRLALYLSRGEEAAEEPVPDVRDLTEEES